MRKVGSRGRSREREVGVEEKMEGEEEDRRVNEMIGRKRESEKNRDRDRHRETETEREKGRGGENRGMERRIVKRKRRGREE